MLTACSGGTADIVFVVDRSGSICNDETVFECDNWDLVLNFMENMVGELTIGSDATRVGVISYGNQAYGTGENPRSGAPFRRAVDSG